ncbi:MAG: class I SAM-dependent methyltransferase [Acidobacteriaceae bacterium]|nr:class I SAM-dependent methyltransferase [Acidobacteriaceae bacterium]
MNFRQFAQRYIKLLRSRQKVSSRYFTSAPSPQNALDIFKGEWWSRLPGSFSQLRAGEIRTFEDPRIAWALSEFGSVEGQSVLELGPLEAGHSYMLERAGFASVTAIEANPRAYLRCLIVKELTGLTRTRFLAGDFVEYLRAAPSRFDAVIASGILYHLANPVELIALLSRVTGRLFLWTHYYDAVLISHKPKTAASFTGEDQIDYEGFSAQLFRQQYGRSFGMRRFCGGSRPHSHWMRREDILACLRHFGFTEIRIGFEEPDHASGPAFALVAMNQTGS